MAIPTKEQMAAEASKYSGQVVPEDSSLHKLVISIAEEMNIGQKTGISVDKFAVQVDAQDPANAHVGLDVVDKKLRQVVKLGVDRLENSGPEAVVGSIKHEFGHTIIDKFAKNELPAKTEECVADAIAGKEHIKTSLYNAKINTDYYANASLDHPAERDRLRASFIWAGIEKKTGKTLNIQDKKDIEMLEMKEDCTFSLENVAGKFGLSQKDMQGIVEHADKEVQKVDLVMGKLGAAVRNPDSNTYVATNKPQQDLGVGR